MKFYNTKHFCLRLSERSLSLENVKNVISYYDSVERLNRGKHGGFLKKFKKTVDHKTLVVVAEIKNNDCWLATAYYED